MSAKSGYRRLLRSAKHVFGKDLYAYQSARQELKAQFIKNKDVTDSNELKKLLLGIEEVDEMLRFNVVQVRIRHRDIAICIQVYHGYSDASSLLSHCGRGP
jgi:Complex 1 protein (LYR family)